MLVRGCIDHSPIGPVTVVASPKGLVGIHLGRRPRGRESERTTVSEPSALANLEGALEAIHDYLEGRRDSLDLPIDWGWLDATPFSIALWRTCRRVPFGRVVTYSELARRVGSPRAFRAVGQAMARNPLPLVVPCHRVLRSDFRLGGFSAGLGRKRWLLEREGWRVVGDRVVRP
jgi:O-6-methylguanine DNA methyltransferase